MGNFYLHRNTGQWVRKGLPFVLSSISLHAAAVVSLPAYNVDLFSQTTISGVSSGAYIWQRSSALRTHPS